MWSLGLGVGGFRVSGVGIRAWEVQGLGFRG